MFIRSGPLMTRPLSSLQLDKDRLTCTARRWTVRKRRNDCVPPISDSPLTTGRRTESWSYMSNWRKTAKRTFSLYHLTAVNRYRLVPPSLTNVTQQYHRPATGWLTYQTTPAHTRFTFRLSRTRGARKRISIGGAFAPRWRGEEKELFYS